MKVRKNLCKKCAQTEETGEKPFYLTGRSPCEGCGKPSYGEFEWRDRKWSRFAVYRKH